MNTDVMPITKIDENLPSMTKIQLIKHQSLDQELEDLISKEPIFVIDEKEEF